MPICNMQLLAVNNPSIIIRQNIHGTDKIMYSNEKKNDRMILYFEIFRM